jgi:hypothetical protein
VDQQPAPPFSPEAPPAQPWNGKTNGFAIASFTMSLFGCVGLLSVIFAVIALGQTRRNGDRRGRRFAIAALSICGLWVAAFAVAVLVNAEWGPDRDANGVVTGERSVTLAGLRVGDCIEDVDKPGSYVDVVPCATAHDTEVFARYDLPAGDWSGDTPMRETAEAGCVERFAAYSAVDRAEAGFMLFAIPPTERQWPREPGVLCLVHSRTDPTTGSLRR